MGRYSIEIKLSPGAAMERAITYFGKGGLGLELIEQNECCVYFKGGGGHISVTVGAGEKRTTVELETREWDYHVKQFMRQIA